MVGDKAAGGDSDRPGLGDGQIGGGAGRGLVARVLRLRGPVDGVAAGVLSVAGAAVVAAPVRVGVGGGGVNALHRAPGDGVVAGCPVVVIAALDVGSVNNHAAAIGERDCLAAIPQVAAEQLVNLGHGSAESSRVPRQEIVTAGWDCPRERRQCPVVVAQHPVAQVNLALGRVVEFNPLVPIIGIGAHPRHFVDDHVQGAGRGGCHLRRPCQHVQPAHHSHHQHPAQHAGPRQPHHVLHRPRVLYSALPARASQRVKPSFVPPRATSGGDDLTMSQKYGRNSNICTWFIIGLVVWIVCGYFATIPSEEREGEGETRCQVLVCGSGWSSWSSCW